MTRTIRPFKNTDIPAIAQIWRDHHESVGIDGSFPASAWEQVAFGKLAFDPSSLLIYDGEFGPLGFVHATTSTAIGLAESGGPSGPTGLINALCVRNHAHEAQIAAGLIEEAQHWLDRMQCRKSLALGSPRFYAFYLGVGESCGLLAVPERDHRTRGWFESAGYGEAARIEAWELDLQKFRVPMDRNQISIRRVARVENLSEGNCGLNYAHALIFGHADVQHFKLHHRDFPQFEVRAHFWRPEIQSSPNDAARNRFHLMLESAIQAEILDHYVFLLGESFRQLQQLRGMSVRCTLERGLNPMCDSLLQRLGFVHRSEGVLYIRER